MKKAALIVLSLIVIISLCSITALAAPADSMLLRAGGSVGGGGGGGFGGFARRHKTSKMAQGLKDMTGSEVAGAVLFYIIYLAYYLIALFAAILIPIIVKRRKKKAREETRRLMAAYDDFDGFWSYDYIQQRINEVYFTIQECWSKGNMKNAEDMLTPALFEKYQKYLDAQRRDGERNIMKKIKLDSAIPVYAKDFTNNEHDYFWAKIDGSMVDYIVSEETNEVLQGTTEEQPFTEYWKFTRRRDGTWVLAEIMQKDEFEKTRYYKGLSKI